jgi:Ca-activated chloride channel family protein
MKLFALLVLGFCLPFQNYAQDDKTLSPIVFIYDASGSMWGQIQGKTKMEIAATVLADAVDTFPEQQKTGLVVYGHRKKGDCRDIEFMVAPLEEGNSRIKTALESIKPLGMTPLAYSATLVIDHLRNSETKATIILLTDGIESCDGDLCEVVKAAKAEGIDFRLHIIGFGLNAGETHSLECAASAGDGQYYDAADAGDLAIVLNQATSETIDAPEGNVSVFAVKNNKPIDALVKAYDVVSKRTPISVRTYRDTAFVYLPPSTYNLEATPLEGSDVDMITISGIQTFETNVVHQDLYFDAGKIKVITTNNGANWDCIVKVMDSEGKVVASARTYQEPKEIELNPGTYNITIQALAMEGMNTLTEINSVTVRGGETTQAGHNFETGTAFIDARVEGNSIDSVVTLEEASSGKNVAGGRTYDRGKEYLLNPGTYNVKVAPLGNYKDRKPQIFSIVIYTGEKSTKTVSF